MFSQSASKFTDVYETTINASNYEATAASAIAFDAVWALAEALNKTEEMRSQNQTISNCTDFDGELVPLDQFNYSNGLMGCILKYNLHQTNFLGISVSNIYHICRVINSFPLQGPVRFGEDGTIIYTKIRLAQIRADENSE